jgi:hypothetical protein
MLYSELDDERWERRKVEIYNDGKLAYADGKKQFGGARLGLAPVPSLEVIAADSAFEPQEISAVEFELVWNEAACRR